MEATGRDARRIAPASRPGGAGSRRPLAIALAAVLALGATLAVAREDAGILDVIIADAAARLKRQDTSASAVAALPGRAAAPDVRARPAPPRQPRRALAEAETPSSPPTPRFAALNATPRPAPGAPAGTVCVRLCDGYAFPVNGPAASALGRQKACEAGCPGASVRAYAAPLGPERLDLARAEDGSSYRSLRAAFAFRTGREAACRCTGADNLAARLPIGGDLTLRRGDVFVTEAGAAVFASRRGSGAVFQDLRATSALSGEARRHVGRLVDLPRREADFRARGPERWAEAPALIQVANLGGFAEVAPVRQGFVEAAAAPARFVAVR